MATNVRYDFFLLCLKFPRQSAVARHFYWAREVGVPTPVHFHIDSWTLKFMEVERKKKICFKAF
jgi:hypothetical protein